MQRRPQPSRRRGLLRALVAGVILVIAVLVILLLISSLTAAPAKAPTVPLTPTPPALTPPTSPSPSTKAKGTAAPTARSTSAHSKKDVALAGRPPGLAMRLPSHPPASPNAVASPNGREVAYVRPAGDAYARSPLEIWNGATGETRTLSYADRFVRPVWSSDGTSILFVRVAQTPDYPGALWTLLRADAQTGSVRVLDRQNGLNMLPLGWRNGRPLYLVSTATDSSLFTLSRGTRHFISIMMPQVITAAFLSRDAKYVAFAAPSDCFFCTYDTFNLDMLHPLVGPSGGHNENDIAWARRGDDMAVPLKDRIGIVKADTVGMVATYPPPAGLPPIWPHPMTFRRTAHTLTLTDTVTHATYTSTR